VEIDNKAKKKILVVIASCESNVVISLLFEKISLPLKRYRNDGKKLEIAKIKNPVIG